MEGTAEEKYPVSRSPGAPREPRGPSPAPGRVLTCYHPVCESLQTAPGAPGARFPRGISQGPTPHILSIHT